MTHRPDLLVPLSTMRPGQARLKVLGTRKDPLLMCTPPFKLPSYWWWHLSGFSRPSASNRELLKSLRQARKAGGPDARPVVLDLVASDLDVVLGSLRLESGTVTPGEAAPFLSWVLEAESLHPTGWHVSREMTQLLTESIPATESARKRFAWEVIHAANLLIAALFDEASAWMWLDLGQAVVDNWPRNAQEKRAVAELARQSGQEFETTLHEIAHVAAMEAARDLQENDEFRLDPRGNDSAHVKRRFLGGHELPLPDLARAFQSRAIRHMRHRLFPSPLPELEDQDSPDSLSPLAALEASSELDALRAVASPRQLEILDALGQAIADGHEGQQACNVAAERLGMNPSTLRVHRSRLRKKLGGM
jgi:hypothetical protein